MGGTASVEGTVAGAGGENGFSTTPASDAARMVSGFDPAWTAAADYYIMMPRTRDAKRNSVEAPAEGASLDDGALMRGGRRMSLSTAPSYAETIAADVPATTSARRRRASEAIAQSAMQQTQSSPSRSANFSWGAGNGSAAFEAANVAKMVVQELEESEMVKLHRSLDALNFLRASIEVLATMHAPKGAKPVIKKKYKALRTQLRLCASAIMGSKMFWATLGCREVYLGGDLKWRYTTCVDFDAFQQWASDQLDVIGKPAAVHYKRWRLADVLGHLGNEVEGAVVRQTDLMPQPGWSWAQRGARGLTPDELAYIYMMVASAIALQDGFQAAVIKAVEGKGALHRATKPKSFTRMEVKCTTDHADDDAPRPAGNVDILRCALTFEEDEEIIKGYRALAAYFGSVLRSKNGYRRDFDSAVSHEYRALLINVPYSHGRTWGEIAEDPEVEELLNAWWKQNTRGNRPFKRHWAGRQIMAHWTSPAVRDVEAKMVCEVQLLSRFYLNMRQKTHILYKIDRARDWNALMMDARPDNWYDGRSDFSALKGGISSQSTSHIDTSGVS